MKPHVACSLILSTALILAACGGGGSDNITVSTSVTGNGDISPSSRSVAPDSVITFTVTPQTGYRLAGISGCGGDLVAPSSSNVSNFVTGSITRACTVTANFELQEFQVSTAIEGEGSGSISPASQTVNFGETLAFTITPDTGSEIGVVSGCGGSLTDNTYTTDAIEADCQVTARFDLPSFTVSGRVVTEDFTDFDNTLNDGLTPLQNNNTFEEAQDITNRTTLQGFATAVVVDNPDEAAMHFDNSTNPVDLYRVFLQEGQIIRLQVVDRNASDPTENDLDLGLYRQTEAGEPEFLTESLSVEALEELMVPADGTYFIEVSAFSGTSKYLLQLLAPGGATATDLRQVITSNFVPGEMIVKTRSTAPQVLSRPGNNRAQLEKIPDVAVQAQSSTAASKPPHLVSLAQRNPVAYRKRMTLESIKARRKDPNVEYAEPNYLRYPLLTPDDPEFSRQWHYETIALPLAWDKTVGLSTDSPRPLVAVIDTGLVLNHPEFVGQLVDGFDFISDPENARDGDGRDPDPSDPGDSETPGESSWHGTHVAGTVAAASDNGTGVAGIAWGSQIMPLRALGLMGGSNFDILEAARFAAGLPNNTDTLPQRRADIINMSIGGPGFSEFEAEEYRKIRDAGIIVVASAGNDSSNSLAFPAGYESVLSVGATNGDGTRAGFSNTDNDLDLSAPGGAENAGFGSGPGIFSTFANDESGDIEPTLTYLQGTSMAAPHVSGVLALMKDIYPGLTPDDVDRALAAGAVTDDLGDPGRDPAFGYGQINANKAVVAAQQLKDGEEFALPVNLQLDPAKVNLGLEESTLVTLDNAGDGDPAISISTTVDWLTVEPQEVDPFGLGDYRISVDRTGLADGFYRGRVNFLADTGDLEELRVDMQVGTDISIQGRSPQIFVSLITVPDEETQLDVLAQPNDDGSLSFEFPEVNPGLYRLAAGSDIDADLFLGQAGEMFGFYPTLEQRAPVEVTDNNRTGLEFEVRVLLPLLTTEFDTEIPLDE